MLRLPLIVEGRYDKSAVLGMFSGTVITTNGFGIFNNEEKRALLKKLSERSEILLLTDSDGGGKQIRSFLSGILPKEKVIHLYIPEIQGKEKRKRHAGKAGVLGVEGVGGEVLMKLLSPYITDEKMPGRADITAADLYSCGLSGGEGSATLRDRLADKVGLPHGMSAKAFLAALNLIITREELYMAVGEQD